MEKRVLKSWVCGQWLAGKGEETSLLNPATEELVAVTSTEGLDRAAALQWARDKGGAALRALNFGERGALLKRFASLIHEHREELISLAVANGGNTRGDAKFDVDGASGTLMYYAALGKGLGEARWLPDGEWEQLGRTPRYFAHHLWAPREGVAVLINAFNFPAWGMAEKAAVALLAGMPVLVKPAPSTALVAVRIAELAWQAQTFPDGAFSMLAGEPGDLVDHLQTQDVLAFTGSSAVGQILRQRAAVVQSGARVQVEADSLNAAVLGPDVDLDGELFDVFLADISRDITQKAGQKCTALRRIFVPEAAVEAAREALVERLQRAVVGNPANADITMGPVTSAQQRAHVQSGIEALSAGAEVCFGTAAFEPLGAPPNKGFFVSPHLLLAPEAGRLDATTHPVHHREVFGPVSTLVPYDGQPETAAELVKRGAGGLVTAVYSEDRSFLQPLVGALAANQGRLYLAHPKTASESMGPGAVLPQLIHGGPGRAGAGEELGGARGLHHFMQRTAVQGYRPLLDKLLGF